MQKKVNEQTRQALMDALLHEAEVRQDCPVPDEILDYESGDLMKPAAVKLALHFLACHACQEELAQLRNLNMDHVQNVSAVSWLDKLVAEGRNVIRALQMPNRTPQFALRGEVSQNELIFEFDAYKLFLAFQPIPGESAGFLVEGQVWHEHEPLNLDGVQIQLFGSGGGTAVSEGDYFGLFGFDSVVSGRYGIHLPLPQQHSLVVEGFDIL